LVAAFVEAAFLVTVFFAAIVGNQCPTARARERRANQLPCRTAAVDRSR
jgi:hypothetical protein